MSHLNNIFVYIAIFCAIFFSYLFIQMFLTEAPKIGANKQTRGKLPIFFAMGYWLFSMFSVSIGALWKKHSYNAYEKMQQSLIASNLKLTPEIIFTSQFLMCIFSSE